MSAILDSRLKNRRLPSVDAPQVDDQSLRQFLEGVKEHIRMYEGDSGAPKERFITIEELELAGIVSTKVQSGFASIVETALGPVGTSTGSAGSGIRTLRALDDTSVVGISAGEGIVWSGSKYVPIQLPPFSVEPATRYDMMFRGAGGWENTDQELIWNPDLGYMQLAQEIAINWLDANGVSQELLILQDGLIGDPDFDSVVLLLPFEGADAAVTTTDLSNSAHTVTFAGNAQIDTDQFNNGSSSALFAGTGDWLTLADHVDWHFAAEDFTLNLAVRFTSDVTTAQYLLGHYSAADNQRSWLLGFAGSGVGLRFGYDDGVSGEVFVNRAWTPTAGIWYELAVSRIGSDLRLFLDGVQQGATHNIGAASLRDSTTTVVIGALGTSTTPVASLSGHIDDVRITKGVGRYAAGYTLPTEAWPAIGGFLGFVIGNSNYPTEILGTDLQVPPTATFQQTLNVEGNATFGSDLVIEGPSDVGSVLYTHDDTDFFTTYLNTTIHNISGATINITEQPSGTKTFTIDGELTGSATVPLVHWYDVGTNIDRRLFLVSEDGGETETDGFYIDMNFSPSTIDNRIVIGNTGVGALGDIIAFRAGGDVQIVGGATLQIFDSTNTDFARFSHDDTDFITAFTTTSDWNISGLTTMTLDGTAPRFRFNENDAAADEGLWDFSIEAGVFELRTRTDIDGAGVSILSVNRGTGTAVTDLDFNVLINPSAITNPTESVITTNVITAAESGTTFFLNLATGFTSTLPAPAAGLKYKFIVATAPTTSGGYIVTTNASANILEGTFLDIVGELQAISAQDTLTFVFDVSLVGDSLEVESDGTSWFCTAFSKADGGITVSVT